MGSHTGSVRAVPNCENRDVESQEDIWAPGKPSQYLSLQSHRIPSPHPPNDQAQGMFELLRPLWFSLTPYQEPAGNPSYRNLLWSGAGTRGGTASPLSGPFLLAGLPYAMGHRLRDPFIRWCKGGELGVTASELGGLLYTCRTHMWTWAMNRFGRTETRRKKEPLNGNLTAENESISKLFTLFSPLPTASAKPAASGIDLFHSWFSQSLGGHLVLISSHYRKWKFIWRVERWCAMWLERYTSWRLPSH